MRLMETQATWFLTRLQAVARLVWRLDNYGGIILASKGMKNFSERH
jgi:hypothetical protein